MTFEKPKNFVISRILPRSKASIHSQTGSGMGCSHSTAFCSAFPGQVTKFSFPRCNHQSTSLLSPIRSALSVPFPIPDPFAFPVVNFSTTSVLFDLRPELLGSCLWTAGLYLGFSQRQRWGTAVQSMIKDAISNVLSDEIGDLTASFLHSFPFLVAGFGIDAILRYASGSNSVWAVASGLSVAMYGGIYELARQSARTKKVGSADRDSFQTFVEFAERRLVGSGRCHLVDIRQAVKQDLQARSLGYVSDETLRRFVRNTFPRAVRSPNGYYRGLSVREEPATDDYKE